MLDRKEKLKLKKLAIITNIIKYTLGLPLLIIYSFSFISKIIKQLIVLYISVSLYPENLKKNMSYYTQLRKGLSILWSPNKLEFKKE